MGILNSLMYFPDKFSEDDLFNVIEQLDVKYILMENFLI
jgi:hypothetical protein